MLSDEQCETYHQCNTCIDLREENPPRPSPNSPPKLAPVSVLQSKVMLGFS